MLHVCSGVGWVGGCVSAGRNFYVDVKSVAHTGLMLKLEKIQDDAKAAAAAAAANK